MVIIAALIGLMLVVIGQRYYVKYNFSKNRWSENLEVSMRFDDQEIIEGEDSSMTLQITNKKSMPLPAVLFKFQTQKGLTLIDNENSAVTDNVYVRHVFTLMSYQRITRKTRLKGSKRGYYNVSSIDLIANDLMYTDVEIVTIPYDISLYVLPARSGYASQLVTPFREISGQTLMNSMIFEDPFEFRGIRPYQTYDTMKKINWNASAKTGELKVNQFFDTTKQTVVILLNLERARCSGEEILQEESIRIVRTFFEWLSAKGISVCFYTNGRDVLTGEEVSIEKGAGSAHVAKALRYLARIDTGKELRDFRKILKKHNTDKNTVHLIISAQMLESMREAYTEFAQEHPYTKWIIPCTRFSERFETNGNISFVEVENR